MVEKWVRNTRDEVNAKVHSRANAKKALGAFKEEHTELTKKLREVESARLSAEASLKTAKTQVEDQRKKLYTMKLELATQKQFSIDLKAELKKVKDAAEKAIRAAKEATKAAERTSYERGVVDTEAWLVEEVVMVCRD